MRAVQEWHFSPSLQQCHSTDDATWRTCDNATCEGHNNAWHSTRYSTTTGASLRSQGHRSRVEFSRSCSTTFRHLPERQRHSAVACRSAYMANDQRPSTSAPGKRPTTSSGTRPGTAPVGSKKTKVVRKPKPWTPPQKGWNDRYSVGVFPPAIPTPPLREPIPLSSMDLKNSCSMKLINPPHMMTTVKPTNAVPVMDIPLHITPHPKPGTVHARVGTFTKTLWAADEKARLAAKGAYERASQRARESSEREQLWNDRAVVGEISNKFIGKRLSDLETTFYAKRNLMGSKVNSTHIYDAVFPCKPD